MDVKSQALKSKLSPPENISRKLIGGMFGKLAEIGSGQRMKRALKVRDEMNREDAVKRVKAKYNIK